MDTYHLFKFIKIKHISLLTFLIILSHFGYTSYNLMKATCTHAFIEIEFNFKNMIYHLY